MYSREFGATDLFVVDQIDVISGASGGYVASGGRGRPWAAWPAEDEALALTGHRYTLPETLAMTFDGERE